MKWQLVHLLASIVLSGLSVVPTYGMNIKRANKCNGYQELCNRKYSNITYIGAHDSYAVGDQLSDLGANQLTNVSSQLSDGIRLLQIQGHKSGKGTTSDNPSGISLCHTSCAILDGGTLESYLSDVASFLKSNPNEVVTIIIANVDNIEASSWSKGFQNAGLDNMAYKPSQSTVGKDNWPTLQEMISKDQRLVVFIDNHYDFSSVNYILPEFKNVWENPYDQTSSNFNCTPDRYSGNTKEMMYLINHYLDVNKSILNNKFKSPDVDNLNQTNSVDSIMKDATHCASNMNSYPTFVLVDFYTSGDGSVFKAVSEMNGVKYKAKPLSQPESKEKNGARAQAFMTPAYFLLVATLPLLMAMN
ncbi:hypothetical protein MCAP1_001666 [Malassezia caprae]|uniref:PLC-like phosphodiesterase n=1 Tax=Malassezia caprae TaxID=1381934 RepID=A0AAF0E6Z7_9BASI|nr:hypothetical protein MCAP1_001666 [Malassezia caprae]